ncbi:MAG: DNA-3-methyladenine glycosylase I [Flavobacteriaceae bacterium]|nr:DNA-3-methyladenine glycosylase I [Flavobacteriaceae bacterium]
MKNQKRCFWCEGDALYEEYHDKYWGRPIVDSRVLFECLILETFQSGLSWITVLKKKNHFLNAFDQLDPYQIIHYDDLKVKELLCNENIIRHKQKIKAVISNAKAFVHLDEKTGFSKYLWGFTDGAIIKNKLSTKEDIITNSELSLRISKEMKQHGFSFIGSTTIYSFLQAVGVVNDHFEDCFCQKELCGINEVDFKEMK